jgi:prepilin-type N-terminal cleavage/methylation domain-containing protein
MKNIKIEQNGFTLVELVIAVALVGVLSIVALPKIMGVSTDARQASVEAAAAVLSGISTNNYIARSADISKGLTSINCGSLVTLMAGGAMDADFALDDSAVAVAADGTVDCKLNSVALPVVFANFTQRGVL